MLGEVSPTPENVLQIPRSLRERQMRFGFVDFVTETNLGDHMLQAAALEVAECLGASPQFVSIISPDGDEKRVPSLADRNNVVLLRSPLRAWREPFDERGILYRLGLEVIELVGLLRFELVLKLASRTSLKVLCLLPREAKEFMRAVRSVDFVVTIGKNLRSRRWKTLEALRVRRSTASWALCKAIGIDYRILATSVWSLESRSARRRVVQVISGASRVSVRESVSLTELQTILPHSEGIRRVPDLAFRFLRHYPQQPIRCPDGDSGAIFRIAIVPAPYAEWGQDAVARYNDALVRAADGLLLQFSPGSRSHVALVPQVTAMDGEAWRQYSTWLAQRISVGGHIVEVGEPQLDDVMATYKSANIVISSRLHGSILALYSGSPVMVIPGDPGAKWGILSDIGMSRAIFHPPSSCSEIVKGVLTTVEF